MAKQAQTREPAYNISVKVSEKGGISIYGLQRFPVTLYGDQLQTILDKKDALEKFMKDNAKSLKSKVDAKSGGPAGSTSL